MRRFLQWNILILLFVCGRVAAQDGFSERARKYVEQYAPMAMAEQRRSHVPAAITLGQGILETEAGISELMTEANNHFGIKCKNGWSGETFTHTDDAPNECFKKYKCASESYKDHSDHLKRNQRYSVLFTLKEEDYKNWAICLKKCGYATNPQYAQRLIKIIEDYGLQQYTLSAFDSSILNNYTNNPVADPEEEEDIMPQQPVAKKQTEAVPEAGYSPKQKGADTMIIIVKKQHTVKEGETLAGIAQAESIELRKLMQINLLNPNEEPLAGSVLELQAQAKQKPSVKVNAITAHKANAIGADEKGQPDDYVVINRSKTPVGQSVKTVNPVPAKAPEEKPKPIIIIEDRSTRKRPPPERPDPNDPAVKKEMEFTALKAELDKVVYADDSKLIAENTTAPAAAPEKRPQATHTATTAKYYTVKKGETAFSIAKRNGITLEQLMQWNNLDSGGVKVGQTLKVRE